MMKLSINYDRRSEKACFNQIKDRECFYSNGVLYMKILQQDLDEYNITDINAISIINAGLTYFDGDEEVYKAEKKVNNK